MIDFGPNIQDFGPNIHYNFDKPLTASTFIGTVYIDKSLKQ